MGPDDAIGVILAGGKGRRMHPLTCLTNKHVLPAYDRPMIWEPMRTLHELGIQQLVVVAGPDHVDHVRQMVDAAPFGFENTVFVRQASAGGVGDALDTALRSTATASFMDAHPLVVILGDNYFSVPPSIMATHPERARVCLYPVPHPEAYGVPAFDEDGRITRIDEKPSQPQSSFAVTGIYVYPPGASQATRDLSPSGRNEREITDVNNYYAERGLLDHTIETGEWVDMGTPDGLLRASQLVQARERLG